MSTMIKTALLVLVASVSFTATSAAIAADTNTAAAPAATDAKATTLTAKNFDCTLTDTAEKDKPGPAKTTFTTDTKMFYLICSTDAVKKGQTIKASWIANDTNGAAPANYKIDEKGIAVTEDLGSTKVWVSNFSLSRPDKGWPVGKYSVELYVDNALISTTPFEVK